VDLCIGIIVRIKMRMLNSYVVMLIAFFYISYLGYFLKQSLHF
jgi:hypothetical protein